MLLSLTLSLLPLSTPSPHLQEPSADTSAVGTTTMVYYCLDLTGAAELPPEVPLMGEAALNGPPTPTQAALEKRNKLLMEVRERAHALRDAVAAHMEPAITDPTHNPALLNESTLLLTGTPDQHAWMNRFLEVQRTNLDWIQVKMLALSTPAASLAGLGYKESKFVVPTWDGARKIAERLQEDPETRLTIAPTLLIQPRRNAKVSTGEEIPYIKDYTVVTVQPGNHEVADPLIETVHEGIEVEVWALPLAGERYGLNLRFSSSSLERPIPTETRRIGSEGAEVQVALPAVTRTDMEMRVALEPGSAVFLVTPNLPRGEDQVLVLSLERVTQEQALQMGAAAGQDKR